MQLREGWERGRDICGMLPLSGLLKSRFIKKLHSMEIYTKIYINIERKKFFHQIWEQCSFQDAYLFTLNYLGT